LRKLVSIKRVIQTTFSIKQVFEASEHFKRAFTRVRERGAERQGRGVAQRLRMSPKIARIYNDYECDLRNS